MKRYTIEIRNDLVYRGWWASTREAFSKNGLEERVLVVQEQHDGYNTIEVGVEVWPLVQMPDS